MNEQVINTLKQLFEKHRIIFWYDDKKELRADYEALELPDIKKIEILNNEFGIKYRLLHQEPRQKFLLYHEGPRPADTTDNWLLDLLMCNGEFRTNQTTIWLNEAGLAPEYGDLVEQHRDFFKSAKRLKALKQLLHKDDTKCDIRLKLLAVTLESEPVLEELLESLLSYCATKKSVFYNNIQRFKLDAFLWDQLQKHYNYTSPQPSVLDFTIALFKSCYAMHFSVTPQLNAQALLFLKRWKDSRTHSEAFEILSHRCAKILNTEKDLIDRDYTTLIEIDYFKLIDNKILSDLVKEVLHNTISPGSCMSLIRQRRQGYWYRYFQDIYEAIDTAVQFIASLQEVQVQMSSLDDGIECYTAGWYKIDQLYRKYIYYAEQSSQSSLLGPLNEQIENLYSNTFLLPINDAWQQHIDVQSTWQSSTTSQRDFFEHWVSPFIHNHNKVFVVISDALRYEAAEEFLRTIQQEDRYKATIEPMLGVLPSYTQLGMAALLPHRHLEISADGTGTVRVDGISATGTENRCRILQQGAQATAIAMQAEEFMNMNKDEYRALSRQVDVLYLYHNHIDAIGDKPASESKVCSAVEATIQELLKLVKKLSNANANNILITADHGFLYQHRPLEESDFSAAHYQKETILYRDRRFLIGKNLADHTSLKKYTAQQIGLAGDVEIQISKSINRLRLQGSGSRFVHGGASLQEVVLPVIRINKRRKSDVSQVNVDILRGSTSVITSGQVSVALYQTEPLSDKVHARTLRACFYSAQNTVISDTHTFTFDYTSENPREREIKACFILSRIADEYNNTEVYLRLEEQVGNTSHFSEYKSIQYTIRRSFTTDFDF